VAIDDLHKNKYKFEELDIVSDRNNLRKLFRWATGATDEKSFRIDVERAGQTCLSPGGRRWMRRQSRDSKVMDINTRRRRPGIRPAAKRQLDTTGSYPLYV